MPSWQRAAGRENVGGWRQNGMRWGRGKFTNHGEHRGNYILARSGAPLTQRDRPLIGQEIAALRARSSNPVA